LLELYGTEITEPVVLVVSRREVEQGDLASILVLLRVFLATRENARRGWTSKPSTKWAPEMNAS
jgi:hypothetical protein